MSPNSLIKPSATGVNCSCMNGEKLRLIFSELAFNIFSFNSFILWDCNIPTCLNPFFESFIFCKCSPLGVLTG
jgi:hypothetical protein